MSGRIEVEMPDGTIIDAPDTVTKAEIEAKWKGGKEPTLQDVGAHRGKLLASGLARGVAGLPALGVDAANFLARKLSGQGQNDDPLHATKVVAGFGEQPVGTAEKYINAATQGIGGAAIGPGALLAPARTAILGATSGLGSEASAQAFGDNLLNRLLGGLAGGGVPAVLGGLKRTRGSLATEALRDAKPADLRAAQELMKAGQAEGVSLNLSQAMPAASNIDTVVDTLAQSQHGTNVAAGLRRQPVDVTMGVEREVAGLPGVPREPQLAANNVQEAATGAIEALKRERTDLWKHELDRGTAMLQLAKQPAIDAAAGTIKAARDELQKHLATAKQALAAGQDAQTVLADLQAATNATEQALQASGAKSALAAAQKAQATVDRVPEAAVGREVNRLMRLSQQTPNTPKADLLRSLAEDLMHEGKPLTDINQLNEVFKAVGAKLKQPGLGTPGVDAGTVKFLQSQIAKTRENFGAASKPYRDANAAYETFTEGTLNPVKGSVVGRIAGVRGFDPSKEATQARLFSVFDKGTVPGAKTSEILTLEKGLRDQQNGPEAFQDAVKTWMSTKVSEATKRQGGRPDEQVAGHLENIFLGNTIKEQGTKDMLVALARSKGLPDDALAPGMMNMLRIVSAAARRPGAVSGTTSRQLDSASRNRLVGSVGNFSVIQPIRQPFRLLDDWLNKDAYSFMDKLVTSPEGVDTLIKLGKQPVMSRAAVDTVTTFLSTLGNVGQGAPEGAPDAGPRYGSRQDGTPKGRGFLGELKRPDGGVSTELSIGVNIDGKEVDIPSLVPTLTKPQIDSLLKGNKPDAAIVQKAVEHAKMRMGQGKSPFAE